MTDFICLGVPKSGTTSLYAVLQQHKQIKFPKEGKNAYYYKMGGKTLEDFDKRYWGDVKKSKNKKYGIIAENWYGIFNVDDFVKDFSKDIKVIFMIRNPINRCYSEYKYTYAYRGLRGEDERDYYNFSHSYGFDRFINNNIKKKHPMIEIGKYEKIQELYQKMNPDNIKIIVLEDLERNPKKVYQNLFDFLEIKKLDSINYNIKVNEGKYMPRSKLAGMIYGSFRTNFLQNIICWQYGANKKNLLYGFVLGYMFEKFEKLLVLDEDISKISDKTSDLLFEYYYEDIKNIEKIISRDLMTLWFGK